MGSTIRPRAPDKELEPLSLYLPSLYSNTSGVYRAAQGGHWTGALLPQGFWRPLDYETTRLLAHVIVDLEFSFNRSKETL